MEVNLSKKRPEQEDDPMRVVAKSPLPGGWLFKGTEDVLSLSDSYRGGPHSLKKKSQFRLFINNRV